MQKPAKPITPLRTATRNISLPSDGSICGPPLKSTPVARCARWSAGRILFSSATLSGVVSTVNMLARGGVPRVRVCSPRASDLGRPVAPGGIQSVAFSSSSARCMTPPPIFRFGSRAAVVAGLMVRPVCPQLRKCAARPQKTLLELFALLISELQGTEPALGLVCRSKGKPTTIRLTPGLQIARSLLREIKGLHQGLSTPMLVLNSHCLVCEFHRRCRAQALKEDNLSLLRGMNDLQITRLNKKGIFTVNQLSYTFKTRRRPKRAQKSSAVHHFPLRALAPREKKI